MLQSKSVLLGTSLAYMDATRLKVLSPVREIILKIHPPAHALLSPLRAHWDSLLKLWRTYEMPSGDLVPRVLENIGNYSTVLKYQAPIVCGSDLKDVVYQLIYLEEFLRQLHGTRPLLPDIRSSLGRLADDRVHAYYISHLLGGQENICPTEASKLIERGRHFSRLADDTGLEVQINRAAAIYYLRLGDMSRATAYAKASVTLAEKLSDNLLLTRTLHRLATCERVTGNFGEALVLARRAQYFAGRIGNFQHATQALQEESRCLVDLGFYSEAVDICSRALQLVIAGGCEGTQHHIGVLDLQADIQLQKTAYEDCRQTHELILKHTSPDKSALFHANSLMTIAGIDVDLGAFTSVDEVRAALDLPQRIFRDRGYLRGLPKCDKLVADFLLKQGRRREAAEIYEKCLRDPRGNDVETFPACLLKLGDITLWPGEVMATTRWAVTYLAYGRTTGSVPIVTWAFRLWSDIFRNEGDEQTSQALFRVALEEFTRMGVIRGRDECLSRLSGI
ncbi:hypothetical protein FB45DRAFT_1135441 [Roridomyces roridus]|uniref:Uncharacterized protein n=1 Tax=Roridomyces roridus TaxID=1738132 RepID=A0AAD7B297_9AGAR|nr:hypothetical protein FB45DRAFT_1135441 [Roridomyces roridus]